MAGIHCTLDGGTAVLTVDRPHVRNALDLDAMTELAQHADALARNTALRAVILTGAGADVFCAGGDLKALAALTSYDDAYAMSLRMQRALGALERLPVPVIGVLNGAALGGGCETLLATDVRIGESHAYLSFKQLQMGVTTGWGGAHRLAREVGPRRALNIMLSGEKVDALAAQRLGLLDEVVPTGAGLARAHDLARQYATLPPLAVRGIKRMIMDDHGREHHEATLFARTWASRDHQEAVDAFLGKRAPQWEGR